MLFFIKEKVCLMFFQTQMYLQTLQAVIIVQNDMGYNVHWNNAMLDTAYVFI